MTDKEMDKLFNQAMRRMRMRVSWKEGGYEQFRWLFLEAFQLGLKEGQRIYKGDGNG